MHITTFSLFAVYDIKRDTYLDFQADFTHEDDTVYRVTGTVRANTENAVVEWVACSIQEQFRLFFPSEIPALQQQLLANIEQAIKPNRINRGI